MRLLVVAAKARELAALDGSTTHVAMYRRDWRTGIYSLGDLAPVQAGNIVQLKSCDATVVPLAAREDKFFAHRIYLKQHSKILTYPVESGLDLSRLHMLRNEVNEFLRSQAVLVSRFEKTVSHFDGHGTRKACGLTNREIAHFSISPIVAPSR